ncbi:hypothetical protein [Methylotuvimicrobium sp. KM1]|uniref:hypothetical protein n=1 Tax=Methylotuvimicrobium sp. KM1 TaxID=3377707 RepID=UPI00384CB231
MDKKFGIDYSRRSLPSKRFGPFVLDKANARLLQEGRAVLLTSAETETVRFTKHWRYTPLLGYPIFHSYHRRKICKIDNKEYLSMLKA